MSHIYSDSELSSASSKQVWWKNMTDSVILNSHQLPEELLISVDKGITTFTTMAYVIAVNVGPIFLVNKSCVGLN